MKREKVKKWRNTLGILAMTCCMVLASCDSADCSLNNTVYCHYGFYDAAGNKVALKDTLSILAYGTDKVLYNRGVGKSDVKLPMSYYQNADTLKIRVWGDGYAYESDIVLEKTNTEYFESPDCPVNMFHNITGARVLNGMMVDSVVVIKPSVNYQTDENIKIYLH